MVAGSASFVCDPAPPSPPATAMTPNWIVIMPDIAEIILISK